jgi:excisionase family DNA binding protein
MQTVVLSPQELAELVEGAVERSVEKHVPSLLRRAVRKEFLTTDEMMHLTGYSRRSLQHLRDSRQIEFVQSGRKILFPIDAVEKFMQDRKIPARGGV